MTAPRATARESPRNRSRTLRRIRGHHLVGELVAHPVHGLQVRRARGLRLDLLAQVHHVYVDRPVEHVVVEPEGVLEQLLPGECPPRGRGQAGEDLELRRGDLDRLAAQPYFVPHRVDLELADPVDLTLGPAPRTAQYGPDPGYQLARVVRLGQVVVR